MIGHHLQRWIDYHWLTVGAGVLLKAVAEHNPKALRARLSWLTTEEVHFYCSLFLIAEAAVGIVVRVCGCGCG